MRKDQTWDEGEVGVEASVPQARAAHWVFSTPDCEVQAEYFGMVNAGGQQGQGDDSL